MTAPNPNWYSIDIDQSHEIVELGQRLQLNGKSWRVVQIDPGPTHYGYRVADGASERMDRNGWAAVVSEAYHDAQDAGERTVTGLSLAITDAVLAALLALSSESSVIPLRVVVWLEEA